MDTVDKVREHLQSHRSQFMFDSDKDSFAFGMYLHNCVAFCRLDCQPNQLRLSLNGGLKCPEGKRDQMCTYITLANYGLRIGRMEFDLNDGEVSYSTTIAFGPGQLTEEMLEPMLGASYHTYDRYIVGATRVMLTDDDPKTLLRELEMSDNEGEDKLPVADAEFEEFLRGLMADSDSNASSEPSMGTSLEAAEGTLFDVPSASVDSLLTESE